MLNSLELIDAPSRKNSFSRSSYQSPKNGIGFTPYARFGQEVGLAPFWIETDLFGLSDFT
jgi:hypothetical protein